MRFLWRIPNDFPEALIGEYRKATSPDHFDLQKGTTLGNTWGVPEFEFQSTSEDLAKFDDLANSAMVPLVSSRLADYLLTTCPDLVELVPAKIETKNGSLVGYSIVNVRNIGESVDKEKSQYTCIPGTEQPMSFSKLEFLNSPDPRMIVREKIYPTFIVVSNDFKIACDKNQWRGVGLFKSEEF
ncbi:MAG: hypothetical protein CMO55_29265 [Verrucomicrobiales bacterium]|nr:hypothetical protein [Verrucomicrobiales bacterium]